MKKNRRVVQLAEHHILVVNVDGSNPSTPDLKEKLGKAWKQ